ncbi:unnamed protein product, partial [Cylicostephanus goldi]
LLCCSYLGHDVTAKVLIDAGSDVNAQNSQGYTPLDLAVAGDHYDTVNVLLEKGAVVENENDDRCGVFEVFVELSSRMLPP